MLGHRGRGDRSRGPVNLVVANRRSVGRMALGAAAGGLLSACGTPKGPPSAGTPLRIMAINHVWSQAIRRRMPAF
ncbi:hypothetical protein GCM10009574_052340 [Streptomyces asiaticus]|uniref:Lipoprotein n=2 Tax=Streptomyces rhizosphaericus TaxID=114699 RepID=A0ABN1SEC5_9ACTN